MVNNLNKQLVIIVINLEQVEFVDVLGVGLIEVDLGDVFGFLFGVDEVLVDFFFFFKECGWGE